MLDKGLGERFGELPGGRAAQVFTLRNGRGVCARVSDFGARLLSLEVPDRHGTLGNVVLSLKTLADYRNDPAYLGATVGRVAGRIGGGRFSLGGSDYRLACNSEQYCLHGGEHGFSSQLWQSAAVDGNSVELRYLEPRERNGFPGDLDCSVRYELRDDNTLALHYRATTSADTPFNPTHHSYFNLSGGGDILSHEVQLACASIVATDDDGRPCRRPVRAGYNDYQTPVTLSSRRVLDTGNADFYGILEEGRVANPRFAARVRDRESGRVLEVHTTEPGIVFYAGLGLDENVRDVGTGTGTGEGEWEGAYRRHAGLCLETQDYADSINHPELGQAILRTGEVFSSTTEYRFSVES